MKWGENMETRLYDIIMDKLIDSGLSKRGFAELHNIPHAWFIEFTNPDKPFRPLQIKTQALLVRELGIDIKSLRDYNTWVIEQRGGK